MRFVLRMRSEPHVVPATVAKSVSEEYRPIGFIIVNTLLWNVAVIYSFVLWPSTQLFLREVQTVAALGTTIHLSDSNAVSTFAFHN